MAKTELKQMQLKIKKEKIIRNEFASTTITQKLK